MVGTPRAFRASNTRTLCSGITFQSLKAWAMRVAARTPSTRTMKSRSIQKSLKSPVTRSFASISPSRYRASQ